MGAGQGARTRVKKTAHCRMKLVLLLQLLDLLALKQRKLIMANSDTAHIVVPLPCHILNVVLEKGGETTQPAVSCMDE